MSWGELPTDNQQLHQFRMYNAQFCDVPLFGRTVSNWPVVVSSAATCLRLPREYFDTLAAYLPVSRPAKDDRSVVGQAKQAALPVGLALHL
eukprot:scaffold300_cov258-Pinguiococcus_pyrenoidosus.AAC.51